MQLILSAGRSLFFNSLGLALPFSRSRPTENLHVLVVVSKRR